jgi:hypothetical protein
MQASWNRRRRNGIRDIDGMNISLKVECPTADRLETLPLKS